MHLPKKNTLFIDFDGTLIDISQRYYVVYKYIVDKYIGGKVLSKKRYWDKRRTGMTFAKLLQQTYNISNVDSLAKRYLSLIENRKFLRLDRKFIGIRRLLRQIRGAYYIVLVSLRQSYKNLNWQLRKMGLVDLFDDILSVPGGDSGAEAKTELIRHSIYSKVKKKFVAGDTEVDIEAGCKAGCYTIAVCSGIRSRRYLTNLSPEYIISDISGLKEII